MVVCKNIFVETFGGFDNYPYLCNQNKENQLNMEYEAINYKNRNEALAAFRKMIERKKEWVEKTEKEFEQLALYRKQLAKS